MSIARERLIAAAALVLSVLVLATSVEMGRNLVEALLSAVTAYGTSVLFAALGLSMGIRPILKASRTVVTAAVVIALVLYGMGRSLWGVIA
jgi:Trk-type K+ transport system membrane component